jgi:hypothetical protein
VARRLTTRGVAVLSIACALIGVDTAGRMQSRGNALKPGTRVLLDAHNAYPDGDHFRDRLDRALSTGVPLAVEQDLVWYQDPSTGISRSIVSHGEPFTGREPSLEQHFFQRIRPLIEQALRENQRETWPIITLNLDFKTTELEHLKAVWDLLGKYESWLTTARRMKGNDITDLTPGPLMVLTGEADEQEHVFHDSVPIGGLLRLFGAVHSRIGQAQGSFAEARVKAGRELPDLSPGPRTSYRRWWNHPWSVVELGGQARAGEWTDSDRARLQSLVDLAHRNGLWIRFYTLNGHDPSDSAGGWTASYNFGSRQSVELRWKAAIRSGVDFVAVDQYEAFARVMGNTDAPIELTGSLTYADYERLFERAFDVPAGTDRIDIELTYDDADRTVIDLGLRGPSGIRGWSGGGLRRIFVSTHSATYGYTPGPLEAGRWAVVIGVSNIRKASTANYTVTVRMSASDRDWPALRTGAAWYAGDLHTHSGHSDGRIALPGSVRAPVPPEHVFNAANAAGLDFVALTDHNTASHWADVDRLQSLYPTLLLLHGREVTTYRGHMNAFGGTTLVDFRLGPARSIGTLATELIDDGAFVSINHPERPDDETCMGCGWNDRDDDTIRRLQGIEIVNGDVVEGAMAGWRFWAMLLNRGHRLTPIGGSDDHTPDETDDQRIGQPTTVVRASELSEPALLDGLRAGRVYVRTRGPNGPTLELTATSGSQRFDIGDRVPVGPLHLDAVVGLAQGQTATWTRNGDVLSTTSVPVDGRLSQQVEAGTGDWFSLILRDAAGPTLYSGAIYAGR